MRINNVFDLFCRFGLNSVVAIKKRPDICPSQKRIQPEALSKLTEFSPKLGVVEMEVIVLSESSLGLRIVDITSNNSVFKKVKEQNEY
jgi:hypothetical protein